LGQETANTDPFRGSNTELQPTALNARFNRFTQVIDTRFSAGAWSGYVNGYKDKRLKTRLGALAGL
jgi:hypothetical protein